MTALQKMNDKEPPRQFKIGGRTVTREEFEKFKFEMKRLREIEASYYPIIRQQLRPFRRY